MKPLILAVIVVVLSNCTVAQEKNSADRPGVVVVDATSITATVEAIDHDKRTIALKGPRGNVLVTKAGPEIKNFKQIKTGDKVTAKYYEATAIYVRKSDEQPYAEETKTVQVAPPGERPAAIAIDTAEITARVEDIDYQNRTVTLRGPQKTATLKVGKDVKRFGEVKRGDEVVVRHTEALAINVEPAK
jgi:hypothetical protein